ncbi:unnamed protein product [Meganyctiphanes norvegica]|uniref:Coiled-coil domain-containing protein 52 n=1 Tax=Meganyctiphanes norvegica TaxID=48144 RepID=A0AAV2Q584_MEGNR
MANKGATISRKTFQNATRTVEVTVKSIPKAISTNKPTATQYKRNCHLQKENERIADLRNNNIEQNHMEKAKLKNVEPHFKINVAKKKKTHNWVQPGSTWGDTLRANDSRNPANHTESISISSHSDSGIDDEIPLVENNVNQGMLNSRTVDNQRVLYFNGQQYVQINEHVGMQNEHIPCPSELSRNRDMAQQTSKIYPIKELHEESTKNISDTSRNLSSRGSKRIKTRNVSIQCKRMEESTKQPEKQQTQVQTQHIQVQTQPQHIFSERLLSDDAAASPFGESGIQILHQLRQRLQTVGDSEGSRMLASFLESYLSVAGSGARLQGAKSSHPSSASPSFPPVFETPQQNNKEEYEKELSKLRQELALQDTTIKKMKKISTQLIQHQEYLVSRKGDVQRTSDVAVSANKNKMSSPQSSQSNSASSQIESRKTNDSHAHATIMQYQTENDVLQGEVRRQRELIATLELQLTRLYRELESERTRSRSANFIPQSQLNTQRSVISDTADLRLVTADKKASEQNSNQSESECDSAFVEKSGSQLTSKMSSPHSREDLEPRNLITNQLSVENLRENQSGITMHATKLTNINSLKLVPSLLTNQNQQLRFNDSYPTDTALLGTCLRPTISDTLANAQTIPGPIPKIQISENVDRKMAENSRKLQINTSVSGHRGQHSSSRELEPSHMISKYAFNLPLNLSVGTRLSNISREDLYQVVNFSSVSDLEQISDENHLAGGHDLISEESSPDESLPRKKVNNNRKKYPLNQVDELRAAATSTPQNEVNVERHPPINYHCISSSVVGSGARMESTRLHELMEESTFAPLQDVDASEF